MENEKVQRLNDVLESLLDRYQGLSDYAETKVSVLIAFNAAIIVGVLSVIDNQTCIVLCVFYYVISFNLISLFFGFSAVYSKRSNKHASNENSEEKNYFYYKYVAGLNEATFLENLKKDYNLKGENHKYESDISNQIVVLASNANRKFKFFNWGISWTLSSFLSPLAVLIFFLYNKPK